MRVSFLAAMTLTMLSAIFVAAQEQEHADEPHKLGRQKIGDYTVSVIMIGEAEAGHTVEFDIKLFDNDKDPKALRVWVGLEDGKGSDKVQLQKKTTTFGGKVKVPDPKPQASKVWVEVETENGVAKGSYVVEEHKH